MSIWDAYKQAMKYTNPIGWLIIQGAEKSVSSMDSASAEGLAKLQEEAEKQRLKMQFAQQQARVEQELAIARRIENATDVEIEEF